MRAGWRRKCRINVDNVHVGSVFLCLDGESVKKGIPFCVV